MQLTVFKLIEEALDWNFQHLHEKTEKTVSTVYAGSFVLAAWAFPLKNYKDLVMV